MPFLAELTQTRQFCLSEGSSLDPGTPVLPTAQTWKLSGLCAAAAIEAGGEAEPCMVPPLPGAGWQGQEDSESLLCSILFLLAAEVFQ